MNYACVDTSLRTVIGIILLASCGGGKSDFPVKGRIAKLTGAFIYPIDSGLPISGIRLAYNKEVLLLGRSGQFYSIKYKDSPARIWADDVKVFADELVTYKYVKSLSGGPLFEVPGGREIKRLNHGQKVLSIEAREIGAGRNPESLETWIRIRSQDSTASGWINERLLSDERATFYFASIARSGLNLREHPSLQAARKEVIPFKGIGRALFRQPRKFTIEGRTGSWMQIEYQGKTGWVFSGFAVIGESPDHLLSAMNVASLEYFQSLYETPKDVPMTTDFLPAVSGSEEVQKLYGYDLTLFRKPPAPDACETEPVSSLQIHKTGSGRMVEFSPAAGLRIRPGPVAQSVELFESFCSCCCPHTSTTLLLLLSDQVLALPHQDDLPGAGVCEWGPVDSIRFGQEMRVSADKRSMYLHLRYPACAVEDSEGMVFTGIIKSEESISELFVRLRLTGGLPEITRVRDAGIPDQFREEWDVAVKPQPHEWSR
ncbi:MAG: SH3 domain-containing protein [Spirochaetales bacterium]|nr:SH3 domain-containing protein [Spirochaetales bacterium]